MPPYDISSATTTNFKGTVENFSVSARKPDAVGIKGQKYWDYTDADSNMGFIYSIPEIKSALKSLMTYVFGQGYEVPSEEQKSMVENWVGNGSDDFVSICENLLTQAMVCGDAFAEKVINDNGTLINLKPLYTGDMRVYFDDNGLIESYAQRSNTAETEEKPFSREKILHITNDRVANEIHGTSIITALKQIIEAKNEALRDERMIRHRDKALGIVYYKTDNTGKISYANSQIEKAVNRGEMVGLPEDVAKIEQFPTKLPADRIQWLQYLDNLLYLVIGIPKVIATSEGYTEAGAKVGIFTFEPLYTAKQRRFETQLWNQLGIRVTFEPAPSLGGTMKESEEKNTGQTQFQPNDKKVPFNRQ